MTVADGEPKPVAPAAAGVNLEPSAEGMEAKEREPVQERLIEVGNIPSRPRNSRLTRDGATDSDYSEEQPDAGLLGASFDRVRFPLFFATNCL